MRLLQTLYKFMKVKPDYEILTVDSSTYTYSDIRRNMERWKLVLDNCGIKKRDKVVVNIKKTIDFVGIYFALCELDCIMIPIDSDAIYTSIKALIDNPELKNRLSYALRCKML